MADLRSITMFLAVHDHGSFTAAAQSLGVAQPWLSTRIGRLERELGYALFERGRHIRLTDRGKKLVEPARTLLVNAAAFDRLAAAPEADRPVLTIGCPIAAVGFPNRDQLLDRVTTAMPRLRVRIEILAPDRIAGALRAGLVDLSFRHGPLVNADRERDHLAIGTQTAILLVPEEWTEIASLQQVELARLEGKQIAVFEEECYPALCGPIYAALREHGATLIEVPELSFRALENFAERRRCAALSVDTLAGAIAPSRRLVAKTLEDAARFKATLYLARPQRWAKPEAEHLWNLARRLFARDE